MATFNTNQVRQLYVAKALKTPHVLASDAAGSIAVKNDTAKNHLYFEYKTSRISFMLRLLMLMIWHMS